MMASLKQKGNLRGMVQSPPDILLSKEINSDPMKTASPVAGYYSPPRTVRTWIPRLFTLLRPARQYPKDGFTNPTIERALYDNVAPRPPYKGQCYHLRGSHSPLSMPLTPRSTSLSLTHTTLSVVGLSTCGDK